MRYHFQASKSGDMLRTLNLDRVVDECPICRKKISPEALYIYMVGKRTVDDKIRVGFSCPNTACNEIFSVYYYKKLNLMGVPEYFYEKSVPYENVEVKFEKIIQDISPEFTLIYNQAKSAELTGLDYICGMGYRKAFEFLIKDYLIKSRPSDEEKIKAELLGKCISTYMPDGNIKDCAKRAIWLGNDETHYERKWVNKDINDLKKLIDLTIHWITQEELTKQYIAEM